MSAALRVLEHNLVVYRRTWRGTVLASFLSPILFLAAVGLGLGSLIRQPVAGQVSYLAFLAPGLLAANAMQTASMEATYPIMAKVHWLKTYDAMLATPLRIADLLGGELLWISVRLTMVATSFFLVMVAFGTVHSPLAALVILAGVLSGLAFATPIVAFSATQRHDSGFALLQRFVIVPLFLLGGAFFPLDRLPAALQVVAWVAPLSHGVALARALTAGPLMPVAAAGHVAVLALYAVAGGAAAWFTLRRRLVT